MKNALSVLLFAATLIAGAAQASESAATKTPLRSSDCIDTTQINEWHIVDDSTATVRTGPKRYLVKLQNACPRLGTPPPGLVFRANESNRVVNQGRICGETGESVSSRYQPPCAIESVQMIDKARFDQLTTQAQRHGNGAEQPSRMPRH